VLRDEQVASETALGSIFVGRDQGENLIQHLRHHFADVNAPATDFIQFAENGWMYSSKAFDETYSEFTRDLRARAWEITKGPNAAGREPQHV
jgi:hypothetical protein